MFFQTSNSGGFNETNFWWSNPASAQLIADGTTVTMMTTVDGSNWSDFSGHFGTDNNGDGFQGAAGFGRAAEDVTNIGLSFGGGCSFGNGVGAPDATLTLNSFTVS